MQKVKISELLQRIKNGETREQLRDALGMNAEDFKAFKDHPAIKGIKRGMGRTIEFEDDIEVDLGDNPGAKGVHLTADKVIQVHENIAGSTANDYSVIR